MCKKKTEGRREAHRVGEGRECRVWCQLALKTALLTWQTRQSISLVTQSCLTPWTAACQASLSITNSWSLLKLMSIESVMLSNHLVLYHPLLLPPSIFPNIMVFSSESVLQIRWPKYWSFSFSIGPSNEYSVLITFRMNWLDLLAVLGSLKSLLQHQSSKASILQHSAFFIAQLSHPYMTTGKTMGISSHLQTIWGARYFHPVALLKLMFL